jgi:hypothetical protein
MISIDRAMDILHSHGIDTRKTTFRGKVTLEALAVSTARKPGAVETFEEWLPVQLTVEWLKWFLCY